VKSQFELLAPGGDIDSILAAIAAGADAIYCGLDKFNARNRATNLSLQDLEAVLDVAHENQCQIFLTLNIMMLESELPALMRLLDRLTKTNIDGVIVQDLGLAYILKHDFPSLDVHISTQMNTHNEGQIEVAKKLGVSRVNLSRELNINEITQLTSFGKKHNVLMEVFVHGSYCVGFSGLCYISSTRNGASGNRGRCSQPCREEFETTESGNQYPMNLKDNSAYLDMEALAKAGVYSLKVEGRIKKSHYVYTVVDNWRKQIDGYEKTGLVRTDMSELYSVFNRDFSNAYLMGSIEKAMFIENPRNFAAHHITKSKVGEITLQQAKQQVYDTSTQIIDSMKKRVAPYAERLDELRKEVVSLKGGGKSIPVPVIESDIAADKKLNLSVLYSQFEQLTDINIENVDAFVMLPNALRFDWQDWLAQFQLHADVSPYFPAVLIDKDFAAAKALLEELKPKILITDNLGVAIEAQKLGLNWIAGRQLNISNSLALECIKREFSGSGAFISNELSRVQIRKINRPSESRIFYSVFHPNTIMTSRQCLFQQSSGCKKIKVNNGCLRRCEKTTQMTNLKDSPYLVNKEKGEYNHLHSDTHTLNLDVIPDQAHLFTDILVDLRTVKTNTIVSIDNRDLIELFKRYAAGEYQLKTDIENVIQHVSNKQYQKGV
jgi:putative protease